MNRTEIKFIIMFGEIKTLERTRGKFIIMFGEIKTLERTRGRRAVEKEWDPIDVTGREAPLPTMIDEGLDDNGG
jgi:hypothetical protein